MNIVPGTVNLDPDGVNAYGSLGSPPDALCPTTAKVFDWLASDCLGRIAYEIRDVASELDGAFFDAPSTANGWADRIEAIAALQTSSSVSAPKWSPTPPTKDGWVLVPRVPTPEMDAAGKQALRDNGVGDLDESDAILCYSAMLAATPQPAS